MTVPRTPEEVRILQLGNQAQAGRERREKAAALAISRAARRPAVHPLRKALQKPSPVLVTTHR